MDQNLDRRFYQRIISSAELKEYLTSSQPSLIKEGSMRARFISFSVGIVLVLLIPAGAAAGVKLLPTQVNISLPERAGLLAEPADTLYVYIPLVLKNPFSGGLPAAFEKVSPASQSTNQPGELTLVWEDTSGATSYEYCYYAPLRASRCTDWTSSGSTTLAIISELSEHTTYYWQVRAKNSIGTTYANGSDNAYWGFVTASSENMGETTFIPAGEFVMGCHPNYNNGNPCAEDELPLHMVYLDAYQIDKYEVSNAQFARCVAAGVCTSPSSGNSNTREAYFTDPDYAGYPVIYVSWYNANAYCQWAGKHLPTEAQWEKAARGTSLRTYPWGNAAPDCTISNFAYGSATLPIYCVGDTNEIGSYSGGASPYGVMDLSGNVAEWVGDWYISNYYSLTLYRNPSGPSIGLGKVLRGGGWDSWNSAAYDYPLRTADRSYADPSSSDSGLGFRCAAWP
jgi:formylglycine-generating enzyme required for sulfatase activity